jgi:hypothetical protein
MIEYREDNLVAMGTSLDMVVSLVENYSSMQYSVIDASEIGMESKELAVGCR